MHHDWAVRDLVAHERQAVGDEQQEHPDGRDRLAVAPLPVACVPEQVAAHDQVHQSEDEGQAHQPIVPARPLSRAVSPSRMRVFRASVPCSGCSLSVADTLRASAAGNAAGVDPSRRQVDALVVVGLAMLPSDFVRFLAEGHRPLETLLSEAEIAWFGSLAAGVSVADIAAAAAYPERSMYRLLREACRAMGRLALGGDHGSAATGPVIEVGAVSTPHQGDQ